MGDATTVDLVTFVLAATIVLAGAVGVIVARNPVHAALSLVATLFGVAVLFVAQEAHFLAAVQVIVYAGAIVVLFLFVIMLLGVDRSEDVETETLPGQRVAAAVLGGLGLVAAVGFQVADSLRITGREAVSGSASSSDNLSGIATSLFSRYVFSFEVTSVLLVIAVIGAVVLARKHRADSVEGGS